MNFLKVKVKDVPANSSEDIEPGYERIPYHQDRETGCWWVNLNQVDGDCEDGREKFTTSDAEESDLRQLLKKEYDIRY